MVVDIGFVKLYPPIPSTLISIIFSAGSVIMGIATGIKAGWEVNELKANKLGETPLIRAAHEGKLKRVKELIREGADPNAVDINGETALIRAFQNNNSEVVMELIRADANLDVQTGSKMTALHWAAEKSTDTAKEQAQKCT